VNHIFENQLRLYYFQVCTNGLVSFNKAFLQPKPSREYVTLQQEYIIAPFYASIDVTGSFGGTVYYRVMDQLNSPSNTSPEVKQLEQILKDSHKVPDDFTPSTVFIVTWERVFPRQRTISAAIVQISFHTMFYHFNVWRVFILDYYIIGNFFITFLDLI